MAVTIIFTKPLTIYYELLYSTFDDDLERLSALSDLLSFSPNIKRCFTNQNCLTLLNDIAAAEPDLALMDVNMPGINGIEVTKIIKEKYPDWPVIIWTDKFKLRQKLIMNASYRQRQNQYSEAYT